MFPLLRQHDVTREVKSRFQCFCIISCICTGQKCSREQGRGASASRDLGKSRYRPVHFGGFSSRRPFGRLMGSGYRRMQLRPLVVPAARNYISVCFRRTFPDDDRKRRVFCCLEGLQTSQHAAPFTMQQFSSGRFELPSCQWFCSSKTRCCLCCRP